MCQVQATRTSTRVWNPLVNIKSIPRTGYSSIFVQQLHAAMHYTALIIGTTPTAAAHWLPVATGSSGT